MPTKMTAGYNRLVFCLLILQIRRLQISTSKAEQEAEHIWNKRKQATELKKGLIEKLELQR